MPRRTEAAFTLVELMVAMALMVVVVMWLTQAFTVQHRTYTVVEQVTETQQNSTAIASLIEREIRSAGFLVPENAAVCGVDNTNAADVLYVSASDMIDPSGVNNADLGWGLAPGASQGFNEGDAGFNELLRLDNRILDDGDSLGFFDTDGNGINDSDLLEGMGVIVVDLNNSSRGAACGRVTDVPDGGTPPVNVNVTVDYEATMDGGASATADILVVPAHVYDLDANGNLRRNGVVLAPDVDDFQVSYFYDRDGNGSVSGSNEVPGSDVTGANVYDTASGLWQGNDLREVRLSVVVRTRDQDPNTNFQEGAFQATENRVAPVSNDRFRRRVYQSNVRVRNVGFRD
jgi:prepilin-type N-terminal cleavage/methylation domain-containing protein